MGAVPRGDKSLQDSWESASETLQQVPTLKRERKKQGQEERCIHLASQLGQKVFVKSLDFSKPRVLPLSSHPRRPKLGEHAGVEGSSHAMDGQLPAPRSPTSLARHRTGPRSRTLRKAARGLTNTRDPQAPHTAWDDATARTRLGQKKGWFRCSHQSAFRKEGAPEAAQTDRQTPRHAPCSAWLTTTSPTLPSAQTIARGASVPGGDSDAPHPAKGTGAVCKVTASPRAAASRGASLLGTSHTATLGQHPTSAMQPPKPEAALGQLPLRVPQLLAINPHKKAY